jgi:FAD/FMN-containing dehydrogenase
MRMLAMLPLLPLSGVAALARRAAAAAAPARRVRPADRAWPRPEDWRRLGEAVGGRLVPVRSPLVDCLSSPAGADCAQLFAELRNPYYIGDEPGLAQTLGWVDAWTFAPSAYAVAAQSASDVAAAVDFARRRNLRLVTKGGGHSYQGTSNAADSLLIWTRHMNAITVHDAFVPTGCAAAEPKQAVSVGAGAIWMQVYDAVTTQRGRYVQGGGCTTVGVAGLIQSGGFGSFSKCFGSAASSLLEAEIVTADGRVRIVNACANPDLYWGIKGGGGGSLGVVTRLTLQTHELPALFGVANAAIQARSDAAFRKLVGAVLAFYRQHLLNPHWGEQIIFKENRILQIQMVSQGIDREAAADLWKPFFDMVEGSADEFTFIAKPRIIDAPFRHLWDPEFLKKVPGAVKRDDRAGADERNLFWSGDGEQCGQVIHGYESQWLPAALLNEARLPGFADALCAAANHWQVSLHVNKGLAGAPPAAIDAARDTATNPAVLDAFALAIIGAAEPPAYPGIAAHEPDVAQGRADAAAIQRAMAELRKLVPDAASYVSESNFFEREWQRAFWGRNYPQLLRVKTKYDPEGLFFVHHGVGSEAWSADGFTRLA